MTAHTSLSAKVIETRVRDYFDACNSGDADRIAAHFVDDGVHYFPPGMYRGPFRGADTIGKRWAQFVDEVGSIWTIDTILTHPESNRAVLEWTHFKGEDGPILRGDEWHVLDPDTGLIEEVRAYYAAPQDPDLERNELGGFDYEGRGYPLDPPAVERA